MRAAIPRAGRALGCALAGLGLLVGAGAVPAAAEDSRSSVEVTVQNAVARVGEKAVIVAKISLRDGLQITTTYRHRISGFSKSDDVELERDVVRGVVQDNGVVFAVPVTPKRPGVHAVTGVIRFSYHHGGEVDIRAARFEATVTATE